MIMKKVLLGLNLIAGLFLIATSFRFHSGIWPRRVSLSSDLSRPSPVVVPFIVSLPSDNYNKNRSYPIYISTTPLLDQIHQLLLPTNILHQTSKVLIVSNTKVAPFYLSSLQQSLQLANKAVAVEVIILPDGEASKNLTSCLAIIEKALVSGLDRHSLLVALGGGVIGDLTGFTASIYQRGIRYLQIPTSLMAMVDSSVGGKTGVNHPLFGKNLIGSFHQPLAVVMDLTTLHTLPDREYRSGLAEVVKYGLIEDFVFFEWLESNSEAILTRDFAVIKELIERSVAIKAAIVSQDERETAADGKRALLNLGHTFGHVLEVGAGYGSWLHGEAVAVGIMMAADLSVRLGWIRPQLLVRIERLLQRLGLPTSFDNNPSLTAEGLQQQLSPESFLQLMTRDKKTSHGRLHLILLTEEEDREGCKAVMTADFPIEALKATIHFLCGSSHSLVDHSLTHSLKSE